MTLASLFDGIGGALLCARMCGVRPVWSSEIEKFPIEVTKLHFPEVAHYGDITKINGAESEPVDIIVGGSPCQDLSVAGKRAGMKHSDLGDGETTRSGLFMEQIRIIKEMRDEHGTDKPRYMVWENVPGAFSSNGGEDFRAVLEETARVADPTVSIPRSPQGWANAGSILGDGFSLSWRTIDAQYWGVAQHRRRIYLVADFGGQSAPEILFEREGLRGGSAESGAEGKDPTSGIKRSANKTVCYDMTYANDVIRECGELTPTLQNRMGTGGNQVPLVARMEAFGQYTIDGTTSSQKRRDYKDATDLVVEKSAAYQKIVGCIDCSISKGVNNQIAANDHLVTENNRVRRLTPLECERLQGYPDGWTDIPGASDSARYKALGNSFAIPCAYFVISGIKEVHDRL